MSSIASPAPRRGTHNDWSPNVVDVLERIRSNSVRLAEHHRRRYYHFKGFSKYFDVPVLVLSIFGSSFAVGTQHYLNQRVISATSCLIGVIVSIITSIKLYLSIETTMQSEFKMSKNFYTLSIDIHHVLLLNHKERGENGLAYMQKVFGTYSKLMEESNLFQRQFENDMLANGDMVIKMPERLSTPPRTPPPPPPTPLRNLTKREEQTMRQARLAKGVLSRWREFISTRKEEPSSGSDISSELEVVDMMLPEPLDPIDLDDPEEPQEPSVEEGKSNIPEDEESGSHE